MKRKSFCFVYSFAILLAIILAISTESLAAAFPKDLPENYYPVLKSKIADDLRKNHANDKERLTADHRVGSNIPLYTWNGKKFAELEDRIYYPVYAREKLADIYILANPPFELDFGQGPGFLIGPLNRYIKSVSPEYCLITYLGKTYAVSKGKIQLLIDLETKAIDLETLREQINGIKDEQLKADYENFYKKEKAKPAYEFSSDKVTKKAETFTKKFLEVKLKECHFNLLMNKDRADLSKLPVVYKGGPSKKSPIKAPSTGDPFFSLFPVKDDDNGKIIGFFYKQK